MKYQKEDRREKYARAARVGSTQEVHSLMEQLHIDQDLSTLKLVDMVIDYITSKEGEMTMREYLFNGNIVQRNYSANYFRRKGNRAILTEAWEAWAIDDIQAFSR